MCVVRRGLHSCLDYTAAKTTNTTLGIYSNSGNLHRRVSSCSDRSRLELNFFDFFCLDYTTARTPSTTLGTYCKSGYLYRKISG